MTRLPRSTIYFSAGAGGTVLARVGGAEATVGGTVLHGVSVVFEARAFGGWTVGVWAGDCAGTSGRGCTIAASGGNEISVGVGFGDVDECATTTNPCGANSVCVNSEGSFSCSCEVGFASPTNDGLNCSTCAATEIFDATTGQCETPSADVCGRLSQFYDSAGEVCRPLAVCGGLTVRDENNQCACVAPHVGTAENCQAPSVDVCSDASLFYDGEKCAPLANCAAPARRDEAMNVCVCDSPNVGTGTDCRAPSVQVCEGVSRFFDGGACVEFVECDRVGEVLNAAINECVCTGAATRNAETGECVCATNRERNSETGECVCPMDTGWEVGGVCVKRAGDFVNADEDLCRAFGGTVQMEGDGEVCAGLDQAGTFCILDSAAPYAFPCRGLFKHLRTCNLLERPRPALNPFVCNTVCVSGTAQGRGCL